MQVGGDFGVIRNCLGLEMAGAYWRKRGLKFKACDFIQRSTQVDLGLLV
jgi:hypothetical protein